MSSPYSSVDANTCFLGSAFHGNLPLFKELLHRLCEDGEALRGVIERVRDSRGRTAFHMLLDDGGDVSIEVFLYIYLLLLSCYLCCRLKLCGDDPNGAIVQMPEGPVEGVEMIKCLLNAGADPNMSDNILMFSRDGCWRELAIEDAFELMPHAETRLA